MKIRKFIIAFILFILCIPMVSKADTWLDDPSYRDTSWFDASTYDATLSYTIDTPEKLAGLLYLVNVENYNFGGRNIYITTSITLSGHDWVPIKKEFNGFFVLYNNGTSGNITILNDDRERIKFIEDDLGMECEFYTSGGRCKRSAVAWYISNVNLNEVNHGTIQVFDEMGNPATQSLNDRVVMLLVTVDDGYYLDDLTVTDTNNNEVTVITFMENGYRFRMPEEHVNIKAIIKKKGEQSCKVISGTGKNLGDEIDCGGERFYVLTNDGTDIKMLAKYNLHTGVSIYTSTVPSSRMSPWVISVSSGSVM